jgi:hypothetical protein
LSPEIPESIQEGVVSPIMLRGGHVQEDPNKKKYFIGIKTPMNKMSFGTVSSPTDSMLRRAMEMQLFQIITNPLIGHGHIITPRGRELCTKACGRGAHLPFIAPTRDTLELWWLD